MIVYHISKRQYALQSTHLHRTALCLVRLIDEIPATLALLAALDWATLRATPAAMGTRATATTCLFPDARVVTLVNAER